MRGSILMRVVSGVLLITVPVLLPASDLGAMMFPAGAVRLNGVATTRASSLLPGDRIETGANSAVTLTASGTSVQIVGLSAATFVPGVLSLSSGAATVNTTAGMKARLRNLTIEPVAQNARFNVGERGNRIYIASLAGRLQIQDGRDQMMLDAGHAVMIPVQDQDKKNDQGNQSSQKGKKSGDARKAGDQTGGGQGGQAGGAGGAGGAGAGAAAGVGSATAVAVAVAAAALGIGFTVGFARAFSPSPVSPAK